MALTSTLTEYGFGDDPIRSMVDTIKGGVVLDVTGFDEEEVKAAHIVIRDTATQSTYKPMPVSSGAYGSLPTGYEYCGVVVSSVPTDEALVSVLTIGEVNEKMSPYPLTAAIKAAFKAAVPTIVWAHD